MLIMINDPLLQIGYTILSAQIHIHCTLCNAQWEYDLCYDDGYPT